MSTKKKVCGYNKKTRRCNKQTTTDTNMCETGKHNYCKLKAEYKHKTKSVKQIDLSKFRVGQNGARSQNGISLSLLKSAMQKYIRRGKTEKAIKCLLEVHTLFIFETAEDSFVDIFNKQSTQPAAPFTKKALQAFGKRERTNIANRLLVITSEEVNIHDNPNIPTRVLELYKLWRESRTEKDSIYYLIDIVHILSNAKKCRLISCFRSAFTLPAYYVSDIETYDEWYHTIIEKRYSRFMKRTDYKDMSISDAIKAKNPEQLFRLYGDLVKTDNKLPTNMWKMILSVATDRSKTTIKSLYEIYRLMSHQEKPIYLYHAMLIHCYENKLNWMSKIEDVKKRVYSLFKSKEELDESYIVDLHVHGKKSLADYVKLLKESFVIEEKKLNTTFMKPDYSNIYRDIKIGVGFYLEYKTYPSIVQLDAMIHYYFEHTFEFRELELASKLRNIDLIKHHISIQEKIIPAEKTKEYLHYVGSLPLAQQRTSRNKKFTRIDFDREKIVKGPYTPNDFPLLTLLKYNQALDILDKSVKSKTGWKWKTLIFVDSVYYLETDFVSDNWIKDKDIRKSLLKKKEKESWKGGVGYYYFERNSKVLGPRIKDMIDDKVFDSENETHANIILDILQHLYHRLVLGVGDTHTSNILHVHKKNTNQQIAGIDLEEIRKHVNQKTPIALLLNREAKADKLVLEPHLYNIKLLDWSGKKLTEKLQPLFLSEQIYEMKKRDALFQTILQDSLNDH